MDEKKEFRKLYASEIECRVATVKQPKADGDKLSGGGCSILLYKDARVDMRLLDERFGMMGWKREHQTIDGRLYCTISVFDEKSGQWVSKQDVGTESYTEKEKGQASDSFKRAGFNWGIGRELYTAPFIWIVPKNGEWKRTAQGYTPYLNLRVDVIEYENDAISYLKLVDGDNVKRYEWGMQNAVKVAISEVEKAESIEMLEAIYKASQFKADSNYINACAKRKNELKAAA